MAAGALGSGSVTRPFQLTVGGRTVTVGTRTAPGVPLGESPVHISETSDGSPSQMTFTIEDPTNSFVIRFGDVVRLVDLRAGSTGRTIFGGWLVNTRLRHRKTATGRYIDCTAVGYDVVLDWSTIPNWTSTTEQNSDRKMVQALVAQWGKGVTAPAATVETTNTSMARLNVKQVSLRGALERVAEAATDLNEEPTRYFYVDVDQRLHWYRGVEEGMGNAPYKLRSGSSARSLPAGSIVPDSLEYELDAMTGREAVYVIGKVAAGSGRVGIGGIPGLTSRTVFGAAGGGPLREEFITRPQSTTAARRNLYAAAFLRQYSDPRASGTAVVTGYDGWRVGQRLYITAADLGLDGQTGYPIVELGTDLNLGNGVVTYTIQWGQPSRSGTRRLARRTRSGR